MLSGILETVLYVDDLDEAESFYGNLLGLTRDSRKDGLFVFFRLGEQMLLIFQRSAAKTARSVPAHGTDGAGHVCFSVALGHRRGRTTRKSKSGMRELVSGRMDTGHRLTWM